MAKPHAHHVLTFLKPRNFWNWIYRQRENTFQGLHIMHMGTKTSLGYTKKTQLHFSYPNNSSPLLENMNVASHPAAIAFICHVGAQICPISVSFFTPTAPQQEILDLFQKERLTVHSSNSTSWSKWEIVFSFSLY